MGSRLLLGLETEAAPIVGLLGARSDCDGWTFGRFDDQSSQKDGVDAEFVGEAVEVLDRPLHRQERESVTDQDRGIGEEAVVIKAQLRPCDVTERCRPVVVVAAGR